VKLSKLLLSLKAIKASSKLQGYESYESYQSMTGINVTGTATQNSRKRPPLFIFLSSKFFFFWLSLSLAYHPLTGRFLAFAENGEFGSLPMGLATIVVKLLLKLFFTP